MQIVYPTFFEDLLQKDRSLRAGVDAMANVFEEWLNTSKVPFFNDYTDHGIEHLNSVLATADVLITEEAREVFTAGDAAILIVATLLHDSALHLSEAGFYSLIKGDAANWVVKGFSDRPWPTLWEEFLFSAKRWDEQRLRAVLGETTTGELIAHIRDPFIGYDNLSASDRRLIGEFIRQNHPRIAHELSCFGVPGKTTIDLSRTLTPELRDIAGLVARSHGMPLRACVDYLEKAHYHKREYSGFHAVFLMALLRVSDYLQIQAERAPSVVFKYRHIPSPFSQLEWQAHNAVRNITQTHDDPESIEIQAYPNDVHTFLRLKDWLAGIQSELDASWAVLGEVYGSHAKLSQLGLILRRVRSNLDDQAAFARGVDYIPEKIELAVARPNLLKLLIAPLYGNVPSIGVRELMQNAIDAVREREALQEKHPELRDAPLLPQESDVEIWIDDPDETGNSWLTISDRGAGMTVDIIRNYFLTAGASFRNSEAWQREFETDEAPKSRVLRSGRFGVGMLAGFMLGSRMEVSTRHIRSEEGIRFTTEVDLNAIELKRDPRLPVGTTIRIYVSSDVRANLLATKPSVTAPTQFDWFIYPRPTVARFVGTKRRQLKNKISFSLSEAVQTQKVRPISGTHGYSAYWTFAEVPVLSVNGISVTDSWRQKGMPTHSHRDDRYIYSDSHGETMSHILRHPNILIEDADGVFPLNLQRNDITGDGYPFTYQLVIDLFDDYLAYLLVNCPERRTDKDIRSLHHTAMEFTSNAPLMTSSLNIWPLLGTLEGMTLFSNEMHRKPSASYVYIAFPCARSERLSKFEQLNGVFVYVNKVSGRYTRDEDAFNEINNKVRKLVGAWVPEANNLRASLEIGVLANLEKQLPILWPQQKVDGVRVFSSKSNIVSFSNPSQCLTDPEYYRAHLKRTRTASELDSDLAIVSEYTMMLTADLYVNDFSENHITVTTKNCPKSQLDALDFSGIPADFCLVEICLAKNENVLDDLNDTTHEQLLTKRWQQIIQHSVIPYDQKLRRQLLSHAYESLAPFIEAHEAIKSQRERSEAQGKTS